MEFNPRKLGMSVIERYQLTLKRHDEKKEALVSRTARGLRRASIKDIKRIQAVNPDALKDPNKSVQIGGGLFVHRFYPEDVVTDDLDKVTLAFYHTIDERKQDTERDGQYEFYKKWARLVLPPEGENPEIYKFKVAVFTLQSWGSRKGQDATAEESAKYVKLISKQHQSAPMKDIPGMNPDELFYLVMG